MRSHHLRKPGDLARVRLLHDESMRRVGRPPTWSEWLRAAAAPAIEVDGGTVFDDSHLALQAAVEGQGVALGRLAYAVNDLSQGRLVLPFREVIELELHYHLLVPEIRATEPLIAGFRRWLQHEAQEFRSELAGHARAA
jgi:LysR family glycine cleavage system transcriptional activator